MRYDKNANAPISLGKKPTFVLQHSLPLILFEVFESAFLVILPLLTGRSSGFAGVLQPLMGLLLMESTIFRFILRFSLREQLLLVLLTLASFPFFYFSLDLPKTIIDEAIGGTDFPQNLFAFDPSGIPLLGEVFDAGAGIPGVELEQLPFLLALCGMFLILVLINGVFKYVINVYAGIVGERMLRRLRYEFYACILRFPLSRFRKLSQGEVVSMIVAETEPLGGFIGDSIKLPVFQGGQLLTLLIFILVQNPILGALAIMLYPVQIWLITKLQAKLNAYKKQRVRLARKASERISEVVGGVQEVHTHDTSQYELTEYGARMGVIYDVRVKIYYLKFMIKFLNNFIAQVTPFFFYAIGGYLVIAGDITIGALVVVLANYEKLSVPWKELLNFYQIMEDARIKYDLLLTSFQVPYMLSHQLQTEEPAEATAVTGTLVASNVDLRDDDEQKSPFPGNLSFTAELPANIAIVGVTDSGSDRIARILAGIKRVQRGTLTIGGVNFANAPETILGRRIAYVNNEPNIFHGSVRDNLLYGLKHRPTVAPEYDQEALIEWHRAQHDASLAGNITYDINADWIDYSGANVSGSEALLQRSIEVLDVCSMRGDVYRLGLQGLVDAQQRPLLVQRLLEARGLLHQQLQQSEYAQLVELFDRNAYNTNMSVAENLLFGTPIDAAFDPESLGENPLVLEVLAQANLIDDFLRIGREVAAIMVDVFADVSPEDDLFIQYSFISAEDLPLFRALLAHSDSRQGGGPADLSPESHKKLLSLPFKLIIERHRLGLIDESIQQRILKARQLLVERVDRSRPPIAFFDLDNYNPAISVQDNILFGRLVYGKARSETVIGALVQQVIEQLDLTQPITELGLDYHVGVAGGRLTTAQRQKLAIARCIMKRPDIIIVDRATAVLDNTAQQHIQREMIAEFSHRSLIWVLHRTEFSKHFDHVLVIESGRVVEQGRFDELDQAGSRLRQLLQAN